MGIQVNFFLQKTFKVLVILSITLWFSCKGKNSSELINKNINVAIQELGVPNFKDTIFLSSKSKLLEYRSSLYHNIDDQDKKEKAVIEYLWISGNKTTVFWFVNKDEEWIAIDFLQWDNTKVNF